VKSYLKLPFTYDVRPLLAQVLAAPQHIGAIPFRQDAYGTPHSSMKDVWVRYRDLRPFLEKKSLEGFDGPHESIWYPAANDYPALFPIVTDLMQRVNGRYLGGILITVLPPGGKIAPHIDHSWHAEYYDKFFLPLQNEPGADFCFESGTISTTPGEVWLFNNQVLHWVENNSQAPRIALIICIK
jgi:Aspartyl/Asparaginyl beta-hydroxylase